jgi:hypothetical protein
MTSRVHNFLFCNYASTYVPEHNDTAMDEGHADINTAAALRAQYAIEIPKAPRRRKKKVVEEEPAELLEPLIDTTAVLSLHSKKTERLQKQKQKKSVKAAEVIASKYTIQDLPGEIVLLIIGNLPPSSIFRLSRTSSSIRSFIVENENHIARSVVDTRYSILQRCFPPPLPFSAVPEDVRPALLSTRRQEIMGIHRKAYYQHIPPYDPHTICTCMTCVFAWNNLCLIIDLHHWQQSLEKREPITMIARGTTPEWNLDLLRRNGAIVRKAMSHMLMYACILEKHLDTISTTIMRSSRWKRKGDKKPRGPRLYNMTEVDVSSGSDYFLENAGPPSHEFPFHRDNYYTIEAYLPNRKWSTDTKKWHYYALPPFQHERDLQWVRESTKRVQDAETRAQEAAKAAQAPVAPIENLKAFEDAR